MDFSLNDEQKMLIDSAQKFLRDSYDFEQRRQLLHSHTGWSRDHWGQFASLGWLALPFSENDGGMGWSVIETMLLLEQFGKALVIEPYIPSIVLGGGILRRSPQPQHRALIAPLINGELQLALAHSENERVFSLDDIDSRAEKTASGYRLNGEKCVIWNADAADWLIVSALLDNHLSLFLVDAHNNGLTRKAHRTVDGTRAASILLHEVQLPETALIAAENGHDLLRDIIAEGILALAAEAMGALDTLLWQTVEYSRTRRQFGVAIGSFQALQHRMANMFIAAEQSRSLLLMATLKWHEQHDDAHRAVHALKAQIGKAGRHIAQEAIQLHGGMGMTDELNIGHYFKRITAIDLLFGNSDLHLQAYAAAV